ncbi:hypothetical protein CRM22_008478 [Opisthorchis felineus]|uniref:Leishmanolysin-like peptidase n=1 Tax=Opisthorchis felineus TaxID=147828 RepID=A0A4S2LIY5_OPIFE|nr:hypothetical protein CRM22_008478 [Opisthorchis felineus]
MLWIATAVHLYLISVICTALVYRENFEQYEFAQKEPFKDGIRIKDVWKEDLIEMDVQGLLRSSFKEAVRIWSETLSVRNKFGHRFLIPRLCDSLGLGFQKGRLCCMGNCVPQGTCGSFSVPGHLFDKCRICMDTSADNAIPSGVGLHGTDLLLYVEIGGDNSCADADAYAVICLSDDRTDRVLVANIGVCREMLSFPTSLQITVFLHEIGHALGLDTTVYAFLRHRDGSPRTPRNSRTDTPIVGQDVNGLYIPKNTTGLNVNVTLQTASRNVRKTIFHLTLPTVLQVARRVFNAPNLVSFPMEDLDIPGFKNSHFDGRTAQGELMTQPSGAPQKITHLLLAYMYDTGWYDVSAAHATVPTWGLLAGEEFVTKSCYEFVKLQRQRNKPPTPFCGWPEYNTPTCLPDRSGYGLCDIVQIKSRAWDAHKVDRPDVNVLLRRYSFGGRYLQLNHCPVITDTRKEKLWYRISHVCNQELDIKPTENLALENFGSNSICLDHDRQDPWRVQLENGIERDLGNFGASCHARDHCQTVSSLGQFAKGT